MERVIGSKSVSMISDDRYIVKVGAIAFQLDNQGMKDMAYLLGGAVGVIGVEDEDMKNMILAINSSIPKSIRSTTANNIYSGSKVSTDDLIKLNQELKHS